MFVYFRFSDGAGTPEHLAPAPVTRASSDCSASESAVNTAVPAAAFVSAEEAFAAVPTAGSSAAAREPPCLLAAAGVHGAPAADKALSSILAAQTKVPHVAGRVDRTAELPRHSPRSVVRQKEQPLPRGSPCLSVTRTSLPSASPSLLPYSALSDAVASATGSLCSAASVPVTLTLKFAGGSPALLPPVEIQQQLQVAFTAAGVHISPYMLLCLRRHIIRSLLACLRYFLPPLLPPVLLPPPVSCSTSRPSLHEADAFAFMPSGFTATRELPFCVAPDEVVHLTFQSWKHLLFFPVDVGTAAVVGLIPPNAADAAAAAALAAYSCIAATRRRRAKGLLATGNSHRRRAHYTDSVVAGAADCGAADDEDVAVQRARRTRDKSVYDEEENLLLWSGNSLRRDTATATPAHLPPTAHDCMVSPPSTPPQHLLQGLLPPSMCSRDAALRALAYWSCLAELQQVEHRCRQLGLYPKEEAARDAHKLRREGPGDNDSATRPFPTDFREGDSSNIRLLLQLKQSFDSVMKAMLQRQQEALDQLRERQSLEMEEASGRREFCWHDVTTAGAADAAVDTHPAQSPAAACATALRHLAGAAPAPATAAAAAVPVAAAVAPAGGALPATDSGNSAAERYLRQGVRPAIDSFISKRDTDAAAGIGAGEHTHNELPSAVFFASSGEDKAPVAVGVASRVEGVPPNEETQKRDDVCVSLTEKGDSRRVLAKPCSGRRGGNTSEREKVEALVLQHVSEFQLVEMHWEAESLLMRRQQLQDMKNVVVDLVLLRRAARQGHLARPLVLPPLPSAFEGDVMQLFTRGAQLTKLQPRAQTYTANNRGGRQCPPLYSGSGEQTKEGMSVSLALRALFGSAPRRTVSVDNADGGKVEPSVERMQPPQENTVHMQKPAEDPTPVSKRDAEAEEVQRLLDLYLPASRRRQRTLVDGVHTEEKTLPQNHEQTQVPQLGPRARISSVDSGPLLPVTQCKRFAAEDELRRSPAAARSRGEPLALPGTALHPQLASSMVAPLPAALQLVTPTKLLRGIMQHRQQRRRVARQQTKAPAQGVAARGESRTQTCGSEVSVLHERHAVGPQPHGGVTAPPRKTVYSVFQRSVTAVSKQPSPSRKTEASTPAAQEVNVGDLAQLEPWQNVVKNWQEERGLKKLHQHAFLPLVFGQQRKHSVVIRVCSGNVTDIAVPHPQGSPSSGRQSVPLSGTPAGRNSGRCPRNAAGIDGAVRLARGMAAAGLCRADCSGGGYDYCSEELACPPQFSDRLLSKVLSFCQPDCCSLCRSLPAKLNTGSKQPTRPSSIGSETLGGADGASGTVKHSCGKFSALSSADRTVPSETGEHSALSGFSGFHGMPVVEGTDNGAAAAATGGNWNSDMAAQSWLTYDMYSFAGAGAAPGGGGSQDKPYVLSPEMSSSEEFSPFAMFGPPAATPEAGALGMMLAVDSSLNLVVPSHLRWKAHLSKTTDFVFPTLDEQRQMLYCTLLQQQHYGRMLYSQMQCQLLEEEDFENFGEEASKTRSNGDCRSSSFLNTSAYPMSVYCCTPSHGVPRLRPGDVFISRHSNSGPVHAAFHLVVRDEKNQGEVTGGAEQASFSTSCASICWEEEAIPSRVLHGIGEVLRLCSAEGVRTLVLPLLLLEGEAAVCSFTYARLQQRALQVVRYIVNEVKYFFQSSGDTPDLCQIVLVLPPMSSSVGSGKAVPLMRQNSRDTGLDVEQRPMCASLSEKVHPTIDAHEWDSFDSFRSRDLRSSENGGRQSEQDAHPPHPDTVLRKRCFPENCWMDAMLKSVISYLRNCGHCWVGQQRCRSSYGMPPP